MFAVFLLFGVGLLGCWVVGLGEKGGAGLRGEGEGEEEDVMMILRDYKLTFI